MSARSLFDVQPRFGERSAVLHVTLGLVSLLRRARALLRRHAPPVPRDAAVRPVTDDAPFLYLCLGVVAFSKTVFARRREALGARRPVSRPPAASAPRAPRDLVR